MRWNNLPVAHKLWGVVIGSMLSMLSLALVLAYMTEIRAVDVHQKTLKADERISQTMRWKSVTELTVERVMVSVMSTEASVVQEMKKLGDQGVEQASELQKKVEALAETQEEQDQLREVARTRSEALSIIGKINQLRTGGDHSAAMQVALNEFRPAVKVFVQAQEKLLAIQERLRNDLRESSVVKRHRSYVLASLVCLLTMGLGLVLAGAIVRSITGTLKQSVDLADSIATGDLTVEVQTDRKDELGQLLRSLNAMAQQLRGVVGQVRAGVESVSSAASQIAQGNNDLSARTEQSAASLQQSAASLEELTATVNQSADTSRQANQLAGVAVKAAENGGAVVQQVVRSMEQINQSSRKISDIIGVIDGIAFQTNILALNAAVEAARAGEQGRGFAVVAGEVRSLAQRSAEAAKEIKNLITASVDNVDAGSAQVAQAGESMQEIVASVRRVTDLIGELSAAASEQHDGFAQVNQAVSNLDQMTQQNAALVEESSAAALSMNEQAQRLAQVVSIFKVGDGLSSARMLVAPSAKATTPTAPAASNVKAQPSSVKAPKAAATASKPAVAAAPQTAKLQAPSATAKPQKKAATTAEDDWESF